MRQLHERADARLAATRGRVKHARDGDAPDARPLRLFSIGSACPRRDDPGGRSASNALARGRRGTAALDSFQRASLEIHRGEGQGETDDVVGGSIGWIGGIDRGEEVGRRTRRRRAMSGRRPTANVSASEVDEIWSRTVDSGSIVDPASSVRGGHACGSMETSSACARWRWEGVGRREGTGSVRGNESNSKREEEQHIARMEPRADDDEPVRTVEPSIAVAREGPRAPIAVELLDEADEVRRVPRPRSARKMSREARTRARRRDLVASSSPPVATLASLAPGVDAFGEDMPPEFARRPANESPRTGRFSPPATARACVRQRCAPPPTSAAMTLAFHARRVNNDEARTNQVNARYVDPYGAANNSYRRDINVHPAPIPCRAV